METLVRVAETGSMTAAARQLHLTPAAVSALVRRVEESLGVRIFERTTRSVRPTEEGLVVLEGCHEVVARWQQTLDRILDPESGLSGLVHVAAPSDTAYQILAPVVLALTEAHPNLQITVHASDALHHIHEDAIDMAIRYGPLDDSSLMARKLADAPRVLVASPDYLERRGHPHDPEDLATHRCLTLKLGEVPESRWALRRDGVSHEVPLQGQLCADGHLARLWAVAGEGIASKSLIDVIDDLEAGRLVRVLEDYSGPSMPIHAVFPSRRYLPSRVRALDESLAEAFAVRAARCEVYSHP